MDLIKYQDKSYYVEHKTIQFNTIYEENIFQIVAVFKTEVSSDFESYNVINFENEDEFHKWKTNIERMKLYDTDMDFVFDSKYITLSTCSYHKADGRFVVVARAVKF